MARRKIKQLLGLIGLLTLLPLWYQFSSLFTESGQFVQRAQTINDQLHDQVEALLTSGRDNAHVDLAIPGGRRPAEERKSFSSLLYYPANDSRSNQTTILEPGAENNTLTGTPINQTSIREIPVELPGVYTYLPHTRGNPDALRPLVEVSKGRTDVQLVIGIPTIHRTVADYLEETLHSLISNLPPSDARQCLILVFVAEPWNVTRVNLTVARLQNKFPSEMSSGLLDVISPPPDFYPDLDRLKITLNDSKDRVKWRTKQNLDYAFLMLQAYQRGKYYIQLEDDVITKPDFYKFISRTVTSQQKEWVILKFSGLGFIGKLFHSWDLPMVLEFLLMFHAAKPGDWLLDNLLSTMMCGKDTKHRDCVKLINSVARDIKPSQFQHIGYHSSLSGKIQKLKDKNFGVKVNKQVPTHQNPAASGLSTTMTIYRGYALTPAYNGTSFFWATTPKVGDTIDIVYSPPISISRFRLVSGSHDHPSDIFPASTVVEVLTEQAAFSTIQSTNSTFAHVTKFNPVGVAEANSTSALGKIHTFRIRVTEVIQTWVILKQIELYS